MLTAFNLNVNLNVDLNVERLPELLLISDNFPAVIYNVLVQHFLFFMNNSRLIISILLQRNLPRLDVCHKRQT